MSCYKLGYIQSYIIFLFVQPDFLYALKKNQQIAGRVQYCDCPLVKPLPRSVIVIFTTVIIGHFGIILIEVVSVYEFFNFTLQTLGERDFDVVFISLDWV